MSYSRYFAFLEYLGKNYSGFQIQPLPQRTIQREVEEKLSIIFSSPIKIYFRSRTDTGVNAKEHPITFDIPLEKDRFSPEVINYKLNSLLPSDIKMKKLKKVDKEWDLGYNLQAKLYVYRLYPYGKVPVFWKEISWGKKLPITEGYRGKIEQIIKLFEGENNFIYFTTAEDAQRKETIIKLAKVTFRETEEGIWEIAFLGKRFLHKMVRMMVGAIIDCFRGKLELKDIKKLLNGFPVDGFSPVAVPGKGLTLEKVFLKEEA